MKALKGFYTNELPLNTILNGDCIEVMKTLPSESFDLIFADPPYNLQLKGELFRPNQTKVDAVNDEWDKFSSFSEYDKFCHDWLLECKRLLKKDGAIWVIGSYHNIFRVGKIMQDIGLWILNDIIWIKTNPMPNFKGTRFNNAHETLIWASKSEKSGYEFHYKSMKIFNDDKQMRSDWYIPICSGDERIKTDGKKAHSTQKPAELLYRIIISTSNEGDTVLDPFSGSGTTAAVAKRLGRNYVGIEKSTEYVKVSEERLVKIKPIDTKYLQYKNEIAKPKVPFGNLIEKGYLKIGTKIFSKDKKFVADINADSSISCGELEGSIHSVSAKLANKESNNGWVYWYTEKDGKMLLIDELRSIYIKQELQG